MLSRYPIFLVPDSEPPREARRPRRASAGRFIMREGANGPVAGLPAQRLVLSARRHIHDTLRTRRQCLQSIMSASLIPCAVIALLAVTQDPHRVFGETLYGSISTALIFAAAVAVVSMVGAVSSMRESLALERLRRAAARLSLEQISDLVSELSQLPDDDHREVLSVVLERLVAQPAELVPAPAPAGNTREMVPGE
jgi:hypothetical protein